MASPHSSAPSSDTSLPHVPAPQVDTQVILPPVVLPTPPAFAPRLSITTQLTRLAYNFTSYDYSARASGFELFLESHDLHHHVMEEPPTLHDPSYASWSQSDSIIITWMLHNIEQNIGEFLACIKLALSLWQTLEKNVCQSYEHQLCGRDLRDSFYSQARRSLSSGPLRSLTGLNSRG